MNSIVEECADKLRSQAHSLAGAKEFCYEWKLHIEKCELIDRAEFIEWLTKSFTPEQLANMHDWDWSDTEGTLREYLYGVYMNSRFMGV